MNPANLLRRQDSRQLNGLQVKWALLPGAERPATIAAYYQRRLYKYKTDDT